MTHLSTLHLQISTFTQVLTIIHAVLSKSAKVICDPGSLDGNIKNLWKIFRQNATHIIQLISIVPGTPYRNLCHKVTNQSGWPYYGMCRLLKVGNLSSLHKACIYSDPLVEIYKNLEQKWDSRS